MSLVFSQKCSHIHRPLTLFFMHKSTTSHPVIRRFLRTQTERVLRLTKPKEIKELFRIRNEDSNCHCPSRNHSTLTLRAQSHKNASDRLRLSSALYVQSSNLFSLTAANKREFGERRIMGYSMEQMYNVVSDVENYNKFLPWCESSVVLKRTPELIIANLVIGMKPVTESYTSKVTLRSPHLVQAVSTEGRYFKNMFTLWKFSPGLKSKPQSCIVDFWVSLEFLSALHANVANVFFNEVVKAMASAFYLEAKRRYGPESVPSRKINIVSNPTKQNEKDDV